jgi:hypothetical protein
MASYTLIAPGSVSIQVNCSNSDPYLTIFINGHSYACRQEGDTVSCCLHSTVLFGPTVVYADNGNRECWQ